MTRTLAILQKELEITMALCGHTQIDTVDGGIVLPGGR